FPEEVQELLHKPEVERTPYERQIAALAYRQITYEWERLDAKIKGDDKVKLGELRKQLAEFDAFKPEPLPPAFTVTDVGPIPPPTFIPKAKIRTDILPGFLTLLEEKPAVIEPVPTAPQSTGRRTALARWLTRPDNPLTARVIVNRLWQHHFGRGIVASASDFGRLGQPPSHPDLLDWLSLRFIDGGWRFKSLHRLMVTSATYRQASAGTPPEMALKNDPENRWLWHMPNRRLEGDQIRDALFAATGELDPRMGGPAVDGGTPRRSIYTQVRRNRHDPLLQAFDGPDNISSTARRNLTTTPTQALLMFNSSLLNQRANALAARLEKESPASKEELIASACRLTLGRDPESWETAELVQFLEERSARGHDIQAGAPAAKPSNPEKAALVDLCHVLLNANEFLYVD
ncbi:MAG TPA: DUF1553 domain-containing protein, partial [Verrucomicrobiae bacterium]|nr:DUF1553 domain-containing protein [Verrucomicrobiae bacterium]